MFMPPLAAKIFDPDPMTFTSSICHTHHSLSYIYISSFPFVFILPSILYKKNKGIINMNNFFVLLFACKVKNNGRNFMTVI